MARDSFRVALASRVKSQDQVSGTLAGICVSTMRMYNFSAGISMEELSSGRELSSRRECHQDFASRQDSRRDPGEEFFLGGIPASTAFSAGFLPRYAAGIFPGKDPAGKTGHLGGIPAGSR